MTRLLKAFWFVTLLGTSAHLLYVYAGLREDQLIFINDAFGGVSRELFFFASLGVITLVNFVLYSLHWNLRKRDSEEADFIKGWLMGLGAVLNFFLVIALAFIQVFNGGETFDYTNFGYLVIFSLLLIFLWTLSMPIYFIKLKIKA